MQPAAAALNARTTARTYGPHIRPAHAVRWRSAIRSLAYARSYGTFPKTMTLGSSKLVHPFPKQAALTAMLALANELGLL